MSRLPLRLIVPSPDGSRVLARPNGLAGWALPTIAVGSPFTAWTDEAADAARAVLGAGVASLGPVVDGVWAVRPDERIAAAGNTWIGAEEVQRLGTDAPAVQAWLTSAEGRAPDADGG